MALDLPSLAGASWLADPPLQALMQTIAAGGGEARVAGGAVRNALLGEPVTEVDVATTLAPAQVEAVCKAAGYKVHPTGIEHGTVTVVVHGKPFEVTTLRRDIETDGRRAKVQFTDDWREDASRRDFTMNALFADAVGKIYDYTNGYADVRNRKVRFVGLPSQRIREDYLRILRFFRFHARYGRGAPDEAGLRACTRLKKGLAGLSAERMRQELLKLLVAPGAVAVLKAMAKAGILRKIIPYTEDWRVIGRLPQDPVLRLYALAAAPEALKVALRLSNEEGRRLASISEAPSLSPRLRPAEQRRILYQMGAAAWRDAVHLAWARSSTKKEDPKWQALLDLPENWKIPVFPVKGADLAAFGIPQGRAVGETLRRLEDRWIAGDFSETREQLMEKVKQ